MFYGFERLCEKYGAVSVKPLLKGWSKDKKYILEDADRHRYLLRLSDKALYEKKREQYELLQRLKQLGLNCSGALEFGASDDGTVYTLLSYLPGVDGKEALAKMTDEEAYRIGLEAGRCLRKLHGIAIPPHEKTWWERYLYKMPKKIAAYEACGYKIPMQEKILEYYKEHYVIMKDRPLVFCHGDYHLGNMIVQNGKIGIIDFDKNGAADPYDDLKPFCWNVMVSEYFETGLINGYFDGNIPKDFWKILKFYTAESLISQLPWSVTFGEAEIKTALEVADNQMRWYENFDREIPTWYKGKNTI